MSSRFNRWTCFLAALAAVAAAAPAWAISPNIVVSQVYGGGGNVGATYRNDFIEIFNRGATAVSVNGWSVQYASATGSSWQVTNLTNVIIQPGQYYLVQEAQGSGGTTDLPTPDTTDTIAMSATAGKVALVNSTTALSGTCPTGASIIDFVGYGGANCSETAPTGTLSNTTAAIRNSAGCTDTDNNSSDFAISAPTPRNTGTPLNPCGAPSTGSCCHTDLTCQDNVTEANCAAPSVWTGGGTCAMNCTPGACCNGESCSITTQAGCAGTWKGVGTTCSPNPCLAPTGSCCHAGYVCEDGVTQANCAAPAGWIAGGTCTANCVPADVRVVTYNLLDFNNQTTSTERYPYFRTVLAAIGPDILVTQEIANPTAVSAFCSNVLNGTGGPGGFTAATFTDTSDALDQALFYRASKVTEIASGYAVIPPTTPPLSPRDVYRWQLRPVSDPSGNSDLFIYSMHLASSDAAQRAAQTTDVRSNADSLPAGSNIICTGDFNIDSSSETSYQHFIGAPDSTGRMYDPINSPGSWTDNATFSLIHTQSAHKDNNTPESPAPAGASTGGLDDRFDFLLISAPLKNGAGIDYIAGTYQAFGNDGQHLNIDINDPPTIPEGVTIADALHASSDHLPVYLDLRTGRLRGDFNANGAVDLADLSPFVDVLLDPAGATVDDRWTADMNGNSLNDGRDIQLFVDALLP